MFALHRCLAIFLAVFLALHLGNHITLFWGIEYHLVVQDVLRKLYRHPLVEPVLLISFATQLGVGARLLVRRGWPRTFWPRMQVASGAFIVLFAVQHIGAALYTRWFVPSIDTNIYWAASVVSRLPVGLYFAPYYTFGVAAVFVHLAAFLAIKRRAKKSAWAIAVSGFALAIGIVMTLSGALLFNRTAHCLRSLR
jgi:hypothetical protein